MTNPDLRRAFPEMPEECRAALLRGARSDKEETTMKRKFPVALIAAAIVLMMTTVAIAEGWSVLGFLNIQPDSEVSALVQPVSAFAQEGDVSFRVESAVTDGEYLVFDWTVNNQGEKPAFFQLEKYTANGVGIYNNPMNDDFDRTWQYNTMEGGTISVLPAVLEGDTLHVEMVIGAYTPIKPIFEMDEGEDGFDAALAQEKIDAGYFIVYDNFGVVIEDPEMGLVPAWNRVQNAEAEGFTKNELVLTFDLDLKAGRASVREVELPEPVTVEGITFAFTKVSVSPLHIQLVAQVSSATGDPNIMMTLANAGDGFFTFDGAGNPVEIWDLAGSCSGDAGVDINQYTDNIWYRYWNMLLLNPNEQMPDVLTLSYQLEAGQLEQFSEGLRIDLPISLK